jgi:hypothetical protein
MKLAIGAADIKTRFSRHRRRGKKATSFVSSIFFLARLIHGGKTGAHHSVSPYDSGFLFKTLHFLHNFQMSLIS